MQKVFSGNKHWNSFRIISLQFRVYSANSKSISFLTLL